MQKEESFLHSTPFTWIEWAIAWRYLRSRKKDGGISVIAWYALLGVTLAVGTLIVVQAVMLGFREEFTKRILGANPHISIFSKNFNSEAEDFSLISDYKIVAEKLSSLAGISAAIPTVKGQVMGTNKGKNLGLQVYGVEPSDLKLIPSVNAPESFNGDIENFQNGVAIGIGVARGLNLQIGEKIRLLSANGTVTPLGMAPRVSEFVVQYIFQVGRYDIDSTRIYMPLNDAQSYFNKEERVDQIDLMTDDPSVVENTKPQILKFLNEEYLGWTWKEASAAFLQALDVERRVMLIILSLVILVAALNIISGLVMLVKNKKRDIAVLRTIGFSKASIVRIFFLCGSLIGIIGTCLGITWGCLFAIYIQEIQVLVETIIGGSVWNSEIRFLTEVPSKLRLTDIIFSVVLALVISFSITILPARNAAKISPAEAIRND